MRNILTKFKINNTTYFLILAFLLTGYIKNITTILSIILFHELGHIFFLILYKIPIIDIEIYPFGGITKTSKPINFPINKDIIIYLGGVLFQIILYYIYFILLKVNLISSNTYLIFKEYNLAILVFNLLPIYSLDGWELLKLILEKKYSYYRSQSLSNIFSIISLIVFIIINWQFNLNNYVIITYLVIKTYSLIKKRNHYLNKFYLERYINEYPYKKIENNQSLNLKLLKKETKHYFHVDNYYINEKELLRRRFDISSYF